jgi:gliding motility-associated lipoprotein GldH
MIFKNEKKNRAKNKFIFQKEKIKKYFLKKKLKNIFENIFLNVNSVFSSFVVHRSSSIVPASCLILLFLACAKEKTVFEKNYDITQHQWLYKDTLNFNFDITDTSALYDIQLMVRHDNTYPFQNLYTHISTQFPNAMRLQQTLNLDLADNTGKWDGVISGNKATYKTNIQENAFFNTLGPHTITLEQFTRRDTLEGIEQIGLALVRRAEKRKN